MSPSSRNIKNPPRKKRLVFRIMERPALILKKFLIFRETETLKRFHIFRKMKLSSSNIKKFLRFSQKKTVVIIQEMETRKNSSCFRKRNFLIFQETDTLKKHISGSNFLSSKKKNSPLKHLLYFGKWSFLAPGLKHFSYFWGELAKPENQTRSYSLELPTYYCTHSSLA